MTVFTFSRWIRCLNVEIPIFCRILFDDIVLLLITRAHWISRALPVIIITFFFQTEFWWKQWVEVQHEFAYINNKQISRRIFYFFNHFCKSTIQWFVGKNSVICNIECYSDYSIQCNIFMLWFWFFGYIFTNDSFRMSNNEDFICKNSSYEDFIYENIGKFVVRICFTNKQTSNKQSNK